MATTPPEEVERTAVGIPPTQAEALRMRLLSAGLLDRDTAPVSAMGRIWFPVIPGTGPDDLEGIALGLVDVQIEKRAFDARPRRPTHYSELLHGLPEALRSQLPTSYDIVGHVALIKLPASLMQHKATIAAALLKIHSNVETVALDKGVTGELRVRDLEVIGGEPRLRTIHREHGLSLEVALDEVYFSPRLATERARLAARVKSGDRVLDLFAGIGALVCLIARDRAPGAISAIDLNPAAVRLLGRNLEHNRIDTPVDLREGDARVVAPRTGDWDHVVMNLPHGATAFLDVAAECVAPEGEVHLYAMVERDVRELFVDDLEQEMTERMDAPWRVVDERHVRNYAPTMDGLGFTLRRER